MDKETLRFQVEKAWDEDILAEFISDYINGGVGKLSDIKDCILNSTAVQEKDIDEAVKYLEMKNMLPDKIDPYKQFVEIYNASVDYDDYEVKSMLAAVYFPHMGNNVWDNAYKKILDNFESLKDQRTERQLTYDMERKKEVNRVMTEALDKNIMTVSELLSNEFGNVSDEGLDADIRLYKFIANKLGVKDYDNLFVAVDDGNYNPEWLLTDGLMIPYKDHKLYMYPSQEMVAEMHPNGNIFMYFVSESTAEKYFELARKFLDDYEIDENPFQQEIDEDVATSEQAKAKNCRWTDDDEDTNDSCTINTLEETLNKRDKLTNNEYDLLNLYLKENFNAETKSMLVNKINEGASDKEIALFLSPDTKSSLTEAVENEFSIDNVESQLEERTKTNGSAVIENNEELLNRIIDWLITKGIDYDIDKNDDTYQISWYTGVDETTTSAEDVNVQVAESMKASLVKVIEMLDEIITASVPVRAAIYNDAYIRDTLTEVLADCDKFDY